MADEIKKELSIGDPVEVKFTQENNGIIWRPGTVVAVKAGAIGVAFSDNSRLMVQSGKNIYRRLKNGR